ncbi:MAG: SDR family NAD(P)-dependent oxidoreductase [Altererythrobacter sp.]|nr:SDR family NAD(P)-dependent oxidoreductase [Altererythrobacter sp.]
MSFAGRTAWITGASSGIGAALAGEFAVRGARVVLSGRDEGRLRAVADALETETLILPFEVTDEAAMLAATRQAAAWGGGVDIFVANAGISQRSAAVDTDMAVYRRIIDVDLTAQIAAAQALLPHFTARENGRLILISSIAGKVGVPMRTAYCAAKFGLIGYADALRAELSQTGVSVHVVCPGSVATDVSRNALTGGGAARGKSDKAIDEGIPPAEAAQAILDAVAAGQREIVVARGMEEAMGELRRTPDTLFDQVAAMVAAGYMDKMRDG